MKWIKHRFFVVWLVLFAFVCGIFIYLFKLGFYGEKWATYPTNKHIFNEGVIVKAGKITDKNDIVLAETVDRKRVYNSDVNIRKSTVHTVGDLKGFVSTGMQSAYLKELCGYDAVNGVYNISGKGNNISLTLDSNLCTKALKQLGEYSGSVGIYNYKTGEIVCMVSTPTFDPAKSDVKEEKGVYVNRFISGVYAPGSIFKLVTALSALENIKNVNDVHFTCNRGVTIEGEWLSCLGNHKTIDMDKGLTFSCNAFFAQMAIKLGKNNLTATAEKVGFNKQLKMDGIECAKSEYNVKNSRNIDFGWSGIGQHNDLVNPYQFISFMGAIANDGVSVSPYVINKITNSAGIKIRGAKKSENRLLSSENAKILTEMMHNNVNRNYSTYFNDIKVCGKTGTAEVGDKATPHSWFTGFIDDEQKPYAFAIVVENAGMGKGIALKIASKMLKEL